VFASRRHARTQDCHVKITFTLQPIKSFSSTTMNSMKCLVNWNPLRIRVRSRNTQPHRWGWVFLERTQTLSRIQFTTYFVELVVAETKQFVSSNQNVMLTRQTCGQRRRLEHVCRKQTPSAARLAFYSPILEHETKIGISSTFWFSKHIPNSYEKMQC